MTQVDTRRARRTYIPVSFTAVSIEDEFWAPRIRVNRERTIPAEYRQCEETGRINALKLDWKSGQQPCAAHLLGFGHRQVDRSGQL